MANEAAIETGRVVADLRRELALRTAERDEALAQLSATAEVLQVINASPGDLAPVFDAMLERAMRLCGFNHGSLQIYDGDVFRAVAVRGLPEPLAEQLRQGFQAGPRLRPLLHGDRFVQITDLRQEEQLPGVRLAVEFGSRTLLFIPLRKDNALLGQIVAVRQEVRPFGDNDIALLENFAAQAVIAMENARLLTETREALEQQTATAEVLQVINASPGDLAPVFEAMLQKAMRLCEADFGFFLGYQDGSYALAAARGLKPEFAEYLSRMDQPGPNEANTQVLHGVPFVHIADMKDDEPYRRGAPFRRAIVDLAGGGTGLAVPMRKDGVLLGTFNLVRHEVRPFADKQIALVQNFAAQAVIAMENARLLEELRQRTDEIAAINRDLEARVAAQVTELERTGKLRRFLAPQLAELIVAQGDESILETHRREIVVAFCDLRGFTAFAERAEPEEVVGLLREYHGALGPIVARFEGTLDHYSGDGIMVFFNDPMPCPEPAKRAVEMAAAMREAAQELLRRWRRHGHDIGFGVGIAQGYATLGQIGFAERMDYTAIGTVCNLAARLCGEAGDGQILVSSRVAAAVEDSARLEQVADVALKGLSQPVLVYNVV